jgi:hypothetical protein
VVGIVRRAHEIFVLLEHISSHHMKIVRIPQRFRKALNRLLIILALNNVHTFRFERFGETKDGKVILRTQGGGFSIYI